VSGELLTNVVYCMDPRCRLGARASGPRLWYVESPLPDAFVHYHS